MSLILLRLAGPLQSWSGYRLALNIASSSPTEAVPRKSAISGLLGAAVGSRDLDALGDRYSLHVRVDRSNPTTEDFQVIGPLPTGAHEAATRQEKLRSGRATATVPTKRGGGNFPTTVSKKDYLSHAEFLVAINTEHAQGADEWLDALRNPVYMTYLGRKSCPPSFPFVLGRWDGDVASLWTKVPVVSVRRAAAPRDGESDPTQMLRTYHVTGNYQTHDAKETGVVVAPVVRERKSQLEWAKENLR